MATSRFRNGLALAGLLLGTTALFAGGPPAPPAKPEAFRDAKKLAERIDQRISAKWNEHKVTPAPIADDAEFLRRVYLDLAGRIPRVAEVRDFIEDKSPDKREKVVEKLLGSNNYPIHFANVWRAAMLPQNNNQFGFNNGQFDNWLRKKARDNAPWNEMIKELVTAQVLGRIRGGQPATVMYNQANAEMGVYYQANEFKPENLAASTSRLFLGIKIECAQCHDHPFATWTRKQFWEYAAFFSGFKSQDAGNGMFFPTGDEPMSRKIKIPNKDDMVEAKFLDGSAPEWKDDVATREVLAKWMTSADNPYFAKAFANRMWAHFFGLGIVDPVDELGEDNPPSHPELLDELAASFAANNFDIQFLVRAITMSQTYQRTSRMTHSTQEDLRLFARMPLKGMSPEQIYDSLVTATGAKVNQQAFDPRFRNFGAARTQFLQQFANASDKKTEYQTSILQALALMNGPFMSDVTSLDRSETLQAVIDSPWMDEEKKLNTLFIAALGRPMKDAETVKLVKYVQKGGPSGDQKKALTDVFWALLNSSEFILNH